MKFFFRTPTMLSLAKKQLAETKLARLDMAHAVDHAKYSLDLNAAKIKRLERTIAAEEAYERERPAPVEAVKRLRAPGKLPQLSKVPS